MFFEKSQQVRDLEERLILCMEEYIYAIARVLRLADGPDELNRDQLALMELQKTNRPHDQYGLDRLVPAKSNMALGEASTCCR